jgi:hypothetical protein
VITTRYGLRSLALEIQNQLTSRGRAFVGFAPGNYTQYPLLFAISDQVELGDHTGYADAGTYVGFTHGFHSGYVFHDAPALSYVAEKLRLVSMGDARPVTMLIALVMGESFERALMLASEEEQTWP